MANRSLFLYQDKAEPIDFTAPPPETVTLDKWFQPFRDPDRNFAVKRLAVAAIAIIAQSFVAADTKADVPTVDKWLQPFSEPVRTAPALRTAQQQFIAQPDKVFTGPAEGAVPTGISRPLPRPRPLLDLGVVEPVPVPQPAVVPPDKWYQQFSVPARAPRPPEYAAFVIDPQILTQPETVMPDKWFRPFDEPVRIKPRTVDMPAVHQAMFTPAPDVNWYQPLSEPLRKAPRTVSMPDAQMAPFLTPQETVTVDKWYHPFSEPVRIKPRTTEFPAFTIDPVVLTLAENITLDKWFQPFAELPRAKSGLPAHLQQTTAIDAQWSAPAGPVGAVPTGVSQPLKAWKALRSLSAAQRQFYTMDAKWDAPPAPPAETITLDKWYRQWEDPPDSKKYRILYQGVAFPVVVQLDIDWYRPLSEPVKRRTLTAAAQHLDARAPFTPAPEIVTSDKWFRPLNEPVRVKQRAVEYPAYTIDPRALTLAETTTIDRYWQQWSEPLRRAPRTVDMPSLQATPFTPAPEVSTVDKWFRPFDEPVRLNVLGVARQRFDFWSTFTPPPEVISLDKWYRPFDEPLRSKPRLREYPAHTIDPKILTQGENITLDKWYSPFSERLFGKRGLAAQRQQTFTTDWKWAAPIPPPITAASWYRPWSEPLRFKARLTTAVQSTNGLGNWPPPPFVPTFAVYATMVDRIAVHANPCCDEDC